MGRCLIRAWPDFEYTTVGTETTLRVQKLEDTIWISRSARIVRYNVCTEEHPSGSVLIERTFHDYILAGPIPAPPLKNERLTFVDQGAEPTFASWCRSQPPPLGRHRRGSSTTSTWEPPKD